MKLILALILLVAFATTTLGCYGSCNYCTCHGMCGGSQSCWGSSPDCYCSGAARTQQDKMAGKIISSICEHSSINGTLGFPLFDKVGHYDGVFLRCSNGKVFAEPMIN